MEDKREVRRKRRKRNQVIVYLVTIMLVIGIVVGGFFGIRFLLEYIDASSIVEEQTETEERQEEIVVVPTAEPTPEPVVVDPLDELVDEIISNMTLEEKTAQLFMITPEALTGYGTVVRAGDSTKDALEEYSIGGLIYFSQNLQDEEQVTEMLANTVKYSKYVPFIAVDEEGGMVSRVANSELEATTYDNLNILGNTMTEAEAISMGSTIGEYLSSYGFNVDLAPVADVLLVENSPLKERIFSADPLVVASLSSGVVNGLQAQEVSACMKHFPGLVGVEEDSHETLPTTNRTLDEMKSSEFLPFIRAHCCSVFNGNNGTSIFIKDRSYGYFEK